MSRAEPGRIVIRRPRVRHAPRHNDSWKIAYADFVTAMMAFFLVMWLISIVPQQGLKGIAEYFRMPLMTAIKGGPEVDNASTVIPGGSPSIIPNTDPIPQRAEGERQRNNQRLRESDRQDNLRLEDLKSELEALIESDPVLRQFRPQLLLDMTPNGLRIQIVDKQNRPMFATGSAQMKSYMAAILRSLAPAFNKLSNKVTISGHTDAIRYANGGLLYSNWELSADRANGARKELVAGGMDEFKVKRVLGLASSVSLVKENPNAAVNRRISLVVLNKRAERRIDAQNAAGSSALRLKDVLEPAAAPEPAVM